MRERHNWTGKKHPAACTCVECTARRNASTPVKKKNKPKSLRGKPKSTPLNEVSGMFADFEKRAREASATDPESKQG
ncbi:MAG: hypothetical protein EXR44_01820 [Dehalococcoidia bacterium]|nr:hypothetical protein [Dehalococcoidia bacterium]